MRHLPEPALSIARQGALPYLVEHWFLGTKTPPHLMGRRFREVLEHAAISSVRRPLARRCGCAYRRLGAREPGCEGEHHGCPKCCANDFGTMNRVLEV